VVRAPSLGALEPMPPAHRAGEDEREPEHRTQRRTLAVIA
jgi:hypothetical protein